MAKKKRERSGPNSWTRKSKYPREFRIRIAEEALAAEAVHGKGSVSAVARKHGLEFKLVTNWVNRLRKHQPTGDAGPPEMEGAYASAGLDPAHAPTGNPEPRKVAITAPDAKRGKQKRAYRTAALKAQIVARAQEVGAPQAGKEFGVGADMPRRWAAAAGIELPRFHYTPNGGMRRFDPPTQDTTTLLSRPEPPSAPPTNAHAIEKRPPSRKRSVQQPLFNEPEPQRVTAYPAVDAAEQARTQAQSEMMETALRQALKERDAFKVVHEVMMREKHTQ